jgi:hypothetical protein
MKGFVLAHINNILLGAVSLVLFVIFLIGVFGFILLNPALGVHIGKIGWYLFAFWSGVTMIVLPCMFPLMFVVVPLTMRGGFKKGLGM